MPPLSDSDQENIRDLYQHGKGTIQDYARIYRVTVPEILDIIGESHLGTAKLSDGDLVDAQELGPTGKGMINGEQRVEVPYSLN